GAELAAGAAAVVDGDGLARDLLHALADRAGDDVVGPTGREGHDQLDRLRRKVLRRHGGWRERDEGAGKAQQDDHEQLLITKSRVPGAAQHVVMRCSPGTPVSTLLPGSRICGAPP